MFVTKCDICNKEIDLRDKVDIRFAYSESVDLCEECASPIFKFLEKNKLFKNKKAIKKS